MGITMENIERDEDLRARVIGELAIELDITYESAEAIHEGMALMTRILRLGNKLDRILKH